MADSDNFESLSNAELRAQCLAHGLPNVPVTDSSRNILIKKLRVSIGGGGVTTPKKTNRRETINVANVTPSQKSKETIEEKKVEATSRNRRTIASTTSTLNTRDASPETVAPVKPVQPVKANVTTKRRSTTREREIVPEKPKLSGTNYPTVILEDDDDDDLIMVAENVESQPIHNATADVDSNRDRRSRSVSLSKSGVLITSYNTELAPLRERENTYTADEIEVDDEVRSDNARIKSDIHDNYQLPTTSRNLITQPTKSYATQNARLTYGSTNYNSVLPTYQPTRLSSYNPISTYRSTTTSYQSAETKPWQASDNSDEAEDVDIEENYGEESASYDTPYLSDFTRTLERLKAESLSTPVAKEQEGFRRRYDVSKNYTSPIVARQPTRGIQKESALRRTLINLDRQYRLKKYFAIFLLVLALVFLYVIFS